MLGAMADGNDRAVFSNDCVGAELGFDPLEDISTLCAAEPVSGVVIKEHQLATSVIVDLAAICQQAFQNWFRDSALLQAGSGMVGQSNRHGIPPDLCLSVHYPIRLAHYMRH
jgi:hypothetical protein